MIKIALAGNPNSGKTTLFNHLTGSKQFVGNWPGVTIDRKEGRLKDHKEVIIQDLPGIYSLSPYTMEEVITRNYLVSEKPDVILNIVDASNIERNLYLTTQILEVGLPVVVSLNMMDVANRRGDQIDVEKISQTLGVPFISTSAIKGKGAKEVIEASLASQKANLTASPKIFSRVVEEAIEKTAELIKAFVAPVSLRYFAVKVLEKDPRILEDLKLSHITLEAVRVLREKVESKFNDEIESIITNQRYEYIQKLISVSVKKGRVGPSNSDKIDKIVTHRIFALPIFILVMFSIYYLAVSTVGTFATDWVNDVLFGAADDPASIIAYNLNNLLISWNVVPWLQSLIIDGIVSGLGAILGFLPQMMVLFLLLAILEDIGYMARIAFILDRIFHKFGLSGKSFIPILISTGCAVPAVQSSRTIENVNDRRLTIITTSFVPCSAKLPIIALITGAMFGADNWWMAPSAYFLGIIMIVISGIILKKTKLFAGDVSPFVMELPSYHLPSVKNTLLQVLEKAKSFVVRAGTIIFASIVIIWFLSSFSFNIGAGLVADPSQSMLAQVGQFIAILFKPLGWGFWQATVAMFTGLVAKENVVSTLGVLYGFEAVTEEELEIWTLLSQDFSSNAAAYGFLAFNLLCAPCFATIGAIAREMNSKRWTWFTILYQTGLGYIIALIIYQVGHLFEGGAFSFGTGVAILLILAIIYMMVRPERYLKSMKKVSA